MSFKLLGPTPVPALPKRKQPSPHHRRAPRLGGTRRWPWHELKIGESFVMPFERTSVAVRASVMGKKLGKSFSVARAEGGFSVTRVL